MFVSNNLQRIIEVVAQISENKIKVTFIVICNVASRGQTLLSHVI